LPTILVERGLTAATSLVTLKVTAGSASRALNVWVSSIFAAVTLSPRHGGVSPGGIPASPPPEPPCPPPPPPPALEPPLPDAPPAIDPAAVDPPLPSVLVVPLVVVPDVADVLAVLVAPALVADVLPAVALPVLGPSPPEFVPQANDANAVKAQIANRACTGMGDPLHTVDGSRSSDQANPWPD
jgi:hypothetical protein